jgi:hypothetical protein
LDHAIALVTTALLFIGTLVLEFIGWVDGFLATLMTRAGINPNAQIALLIGVSIILAVAAIRRLGRLLTALVIVLLVLLLLHKAMPGMELPGAPPAPAPAPPPPAAGQVHV